MRIATVLNVGAGKKTLIVGVKLSLSLFVAKLTHFIDGERILEVNEVDFVFKLADTHAYVLRRNVVVDKASFLHLGQSFEKLNCYDHTGFLGEAASCHGQEFLQVGSHQ